MSHKFQWNLITAVFQITSFAFKNSGQACIAVKRIYVHESIYDEFRHQVVKIAEFLKYGQGEEEGVVMGPVQNSMQYEQLKTLFGNMAKENLKILTGGIDMKRSGYFVKPTIIDNPPDASRVVVEEPFGKFIRKPRLPELQDNSISLPC